MRYALTLTLAAVAVFSGLWGYYTLEALWGYRDSDGGVYLSLGVPLVAISLAALAGIVWLFRLAHRS